MTSPTPAQELRKLAMSEQALSALAEQWLTELYSKAGKVPNWTFEEPPHA